jgi:hypothetical protein
MISELINALALLVDGIAAVAAGADSAANSIAAPSNLVIKMIPLKLSMIRD